MTSSEEGGLIAGRYRLASELGRGAMGVVWLARDERLGRTVAVKELRAGFGLSATQVEQSHLRARREARIAARLHHENAVAVFDVAEHDGAPYLVMEYVPSRSLSEVLAEDGVFEPAEAAEIGVQLASALTAAHEAGIVHRDVKPGNILLTAEGRAKLTDFGISRAVGDVTVTGTGEMLGTPAYVAPEVAQGRPSGAASDVFSLGATLYAAVEGMPPFETGPTVMALLLRIVNGEMRPPLRSGALTETLQWMMQTDPLDRPSMELARRALQSAATPVPAPAPVAGDVRPLPETAPEPGTEPETPAAPAGPPAPAAPSAPEPMTAPAVAGARPDQISDTPARRRVPAWALLSLAGVLTAGIVAAVVASNGAGGSPAASPTSSADPAASASAPATAAASAAASASTATGSAAAATSPAADVKTQLESMISAYYKLVPGDLDQAWTSMTAYYQQHTAGGMSGYRSFWKQIAGVSATDVVAQAPSTVTATLTYHYRNGTVIVERTKFGLVRSGGVWKIASSSVLSHEEL